MNSETIEGMLDVFVALLMRLPMQELALRHSGPDAGALLRFGSFRDTKLNQ